MDMKERARRTPVSDLRPPAVIEGGTTNGTVLNHEWTRMHTKERARRKPVSDVRPPAVIADEPRVALF
jgi:hypothetical protein